MTTDSTRAPTRLLLIEDDKESRDALLSMLRKRGLDVMIAEDAETAVTLVQREPFDVVVADIRLPGMDGIEFLAHVRRHHASLPLILLTGYGSLDSATEAVRLGADDYILKPLEDIEQLLQPVRRAVARYDLMRENEQLASDLRRSEEKFRRLFE
jgi:DNA-binding NtrC family response regulator